MKTTPTLICLIALLFFISARGQQQMEHKNIFLRIYNLQDTKISKGKLVAISDSGILLKKGKKTFSIATAEIGKIKTKRALGHNMGTGALLGGSVGAVIGGATGSSLDNFVNELGAT